MRRAAAALAAALLSLAACAGSGTDASGGSTASPAQSASPGLPAATAADLAPRPAPAPPEALPPAPDTPPAVAALPPAAPGRPRGAPEDVRRLLGTQGPVLREWLGDVVFVRRDGAAEIWRFAADSCFLDVFLYRESDGLRVAHVEARPRSTGRTTPQACYGRIIAARSPKPAS